MKSALVLFCLLAAPLAGAPLPASSWSFDQPLPAAQIRGRAQYRDGVRGKALLLDGFTTAAVAPAASLPDLAAGFTVEAWIAPQEYSWNRTGIVDRSPDQRSGFFLGIDHTGRIELSAAVNGEWKTAVSSERVPLLRWTHVAGTFDPASGMAVFLDGRRVAFEATRGALRGAAADLWIGASQQRMGVANTEREPSRRALANTRMVFDGLIDEVRLYDRPLDGAAVSVLARALTPPVAQPLAFRRMPGAPDAPLRFGAFYERLRYAEAWDAQWRGSGPDVVVTFDFAPVRLVSWRGISYNPCWVTENGGWFSNEFMERSVPAGCAELMSDKQARFSSVKIVEASDARVVLYWRYSPVDIHYGIPFTDPETGWGDWGEEYYTIYPDGIAVRKFTGYSSVQRERSFWEWSQSLPILQAGQRPEDVLGDSPFVSLADMDGRSQDYAWPPRGEPGLPGANIQVVHYRSEYKPFLILTDRNPRISLPRYEKRDASTAIDGMSMPVESKFWWWNHWPVAMLPSDGRVAPAADRPSHSWAANQDSDPWERSLESETQIMLCGVTRKPAADLAPLARSWMKAPELQPQSAGLRSRYDATERAYLLTAPRQAADISFRLAASADRPVVNPAFVVEGWGEREPALTLDGRAVPPGRGFRYGLRRGLRTTDLVMWLEIEASKPMALSVKPRG